MEESIYSLLAGAHNITRRIRRFSESQAPIWKRIPVRALRAQMTMSHMHTPYRMAFMYGYLSIDSALSRRDNIGDVWVDLDNGRLISSPRANAKPAEDIDIVRILIDRGTKYVSFDANSHLAHFQEKCAKPYFKPEYNKVEASLIDQLGLTDPFDRASLKELPMSNKPLIISTVDFIPFPGVDVT